MAEQLPQTPLCFVIGPIGPAGSDTRKHADFLLRGIIRPVLEARELGYLVRRADEDADPGMIGDRVITDILNADLVIADLTDLNPNALYELGIRHSAQKPAIHIAKEGTQLPFDNHAHRTIFVDLSDWGSIELAKARLAGSARAISMPDYRVSNPITQANASFRLRTSADPNERVIALLQERVTALETANARTTASGSAPVTSFIPNVAMGHMLNPNSGGGGFVGVGGGMGGGITTDHRVGGIGGGIAAEHGRGGMGGGIAAGHGGGGMGASNTGNGDPNVGIIGTGSK